MLPDGLDPEGLRECLEMARILLVDPDASVRMWDRMSESHRLLFYDVAKLVHGYEVWGSWDPSVKREEYCIGIIQCLESWGAK